MCTVDLLSKVVVYNTNEVESAIDDTWIVSGMSPEQSKLLAQHGAHRSLRIEGPNLIWLRNQSLNYFVLKGDPEERQDETEKVEEDLDGKWNFSQSNEFRLSRYHLQMSAI